MGNSISFSSLLEREAVKKLEYSPSPSPLPRGERVNILKYKKKFPPPRRGRDRVGVEMGFFHTFREWRVAKIDLAIGVGFVKVTGAVVMRMEYPCWLG